MLCHNLLINYYNYLLNFIALYLWYTYGVDKKIKRKRLSIILVIPRNILFYILYFNDTKREEARGK